MTAGSVMKQFVDQQRRYCVDHVDIDEDGHITMFALGGFVPDDINKVVPFLEVSPPYKPTYTGPLTTKIKLTSIIKQENEYRLSLIIKAASFIDALSETGCSPRRAIKLSGITRRVAEELRLRCPAFATRWKDAFEDVTDRLEEAGLRRAINGVDEGVFYQGERVGSKRVYSDSILTFMLQGRRPEVYKQKSAQDVDIKLPEGGVKVLVALPEDGTL